MRMVNYINHQIVLVISPDNLEEVKVQDEHRSIKIIKKDTHSYKQWENFDLKQSKQGPRLDIKIESPFVIIPDLRSDGNQQFDLDFGTIIVSSKIDTE